MEPPEPAKTQEPKRFKLPGVGWKRSLLAVLLGNLIYFGLIADRSVTLQNQPVEYTLGLALDFWICVMIYGAVRYLFPRL